MAPSAIENVTDDYVPLSLNPSFDESLTYKDHNGLNLARDLVGDAFQQRVNSVDGDTCEVGDEDAFFVADLGEVYRQHMRWKTNLPRVKPHYGVYLVSLIGGSSRH